MFEVQSKEMNNIVNLIIRINGIGEGMAGLMVLVRGWPGYGN